MKLRELNEDRNEDIEKRAKKNFIEDLVTYLQKVLAKTTPTTVTVPATTGSPTAPATPVNTSPTGETPEQKRIRLQKASQQNIDNTTRVAPAAASLTPEQIRQQRQAQAAQAARTGMTTRENIQFARLNALFESMLNVDEAAPAPAQTTATLSPSDNLTIEFNKHMNAPHIFKEVPQNVAKIREFANEIVKTYPVDGGKAAMVEMGNWAWDTMSEYKDNERRFGRGRGVNTTTAPVASPTTTAPAQPTTATQTATGQSGETVAPQEVQQSKVGVRQINKLIPTLRKRDLLSVKKNVDNTLAGKSSVEPASAEAPAAGTNAFGQMAGQLSGGNKSTSSTGGTATKTPTGLVHTAKTQNQSPVQAAPAKDNIISMPKGKAGRVRASREGGVTPEEQAKFDEKVKQAMANQK